MKFAEVRERLGSTGFTTPWLGRQLYGAVVEAEATHVLEIGTAHGAGTSYLAAAVHENGGAWAEAARVYERMLALVEKNSPRYTVVEMRLAEARARAGTR